MEKKEKQPPPNFSALWQMVMLVLSVYVLFVLVAETLFKLHEDVSAILQASDFMICLVFLGDFTVRFIRAPAKWDFFFKKWNWIDLVSSIPSFDYLRIGRVTRIVRIVRILRAVRSVKLLTAYLFRSRVQGTFGTMALLSFILWFFSAIAILNFETSPEANIKNAEDALWWAFVTMTTVGYGDKFPLSSEGRIIAGVLMIAGVGLFGTFTATVATLFLRRDDEEGPSELEEIRQEIVLLREKIESWEAARLDAPVSCSSKAEAGLASADSSNPSALPPDP